uniref:Thioredoxin f n=1 Tax=Tetraselmis sp. GSL018 TaxID=582737 RepID=A0A061SKI3_9CHLO
MSCRTLCNTPSRRVLAQPACFRSRRVSISPRNPARFDRSVVFASSSSDFGNVREVTSKDDLQASFDEAGESLVVVNIGAKTCGPCKLIWPKYVEMSQEYEDATFLKITGDENKETVALMKDWGVKAVPEFRYFKSGELLHKHSGSDMTELRSCIDAHI